MLRRPRPVAASICAAIIVATAVALPSPAGASPEEDLEAAQRRANGAAAELADAQEDMARAEDGVRQLETSVARIDTRVTAVRSQVRELAVRLYIEGTAPLSRLLRMGDANQIVRAQQFSHVIAGRSTDSLQQYRADREDLRDELTALERKQRSHAAAIENLRRRQSQAVEELDRLSRVVEQARAARAEQERTRIAASGNAAPVAPPAAETQRSPLGALSPVNRVPPGSPSPSEPEAPAAAASPGPPASVGSSGWICPVQGPHAFSNDYGASRGGGASHQGNDILAPRGTPVVANVDGFVTQRNGPVSGLAYFLAGEDGNRYFGAHLDSFGASGQVAAGTVIGTVGNTGDAAGGPPHLHFEIHPGGSGNVNPFPTLSRYC